MTLIFYDWEFQENGKTIEPISLGMVSETGDELYLINQDFNWNTASDWLKANVKPHLFTNCLTEVVPRQMIASEVNQWTLQQVYSSKSDKVKLVGYYANYDHVLLAQQFGTMMDLPKHIPMWTCDLKQWCDDLGDPQLPPQEKGEHHALLDAQFIRDAYNWLRVNYKHPAWTPHRNCGLSVPHQ